MGLAGVELLMGVEERFGLSMTDAEAQRIVTVGDLYRVILDKLHALQGPVCLSSRVFYRLRRTLMATQGVARSAIRPESMVETLFPMATRRKDWRRVQGELALELPDLDRPRWVHGILGFIGAGILIGLASTLIRYQDVFTPPSVWGLLAFLFGVGIFSGVWTLTTPLARLIPEKSRTVGDLVITIVERNYGVLHADTQPMRDEDLWEALVEVIVTETRTPRECICPAAKIWQDICHD